MHILERAKAAEAFFMPPLPVSLKNPTNLQPAFAKPLDRAQIAPVKVLSDVEQEELEGIHQQVLPEVLDY
jgi:hypothetical protein